MRYLPRRFAVLAGAAVLAGGGFTFMSSNTAAPSSLGEGQSQISGYQVSGITYQTTQASPGTPYQQQVTQATFTLTGQAKPSQVIAQFVDGNGSAIGAPVALADGWGVKHDDNTAEQNGGSGTIGNPWWFGCELSKSGWSTTTNSGTYTCQWTYPYYNAETTGAPAAEYGPLVTPSMALDVTAHS